MKELELYEVLPMIREELGKDDISIYELNIWSRGYEAENPDIYINRTREDIHHAHGGNYIWLECVDEGADIMRKQESIKCPICGDIHYKYPNTGEFESIKAKIFIWNLK